MKKEKFLTVMAVFDDATQKRLSDIQAKIINEVSQGTQTMGIPFHITLGSYPVDMESEVIKMICHTASQTKKFSIELFGYNSFCNKVLYAEPSISEDLLTLRKKFENDYAENLDWVPHVTLFCTDSDNLSFLTKILPAINEPISAEIVGIELGEFFPPKKIVRKAFL